MTQGTTPTTGKKFEIDINEGHFPNEINTNIHNWTDIVTTNGVSTHPSLSKSFNLGVRPDYSIQLEIPITTRRIRFSSPNGAPFNMGEFRAFNVNAAGYPYPLSETADTDKPGLVNYVREAGTKLTASGVYKPDASYRLDQVADGKVNTRWVTQVDGPKWLEIEFAAEKRIGCLQFLNGWLNNGTWMGLISDYTVQYHNGSQWVDVSTLNVALGETNLSRDFHTYGLDWSPTELVFYFDGKELRREKNEFCHSPSPVWLSLAIVSWAGAVTDAIDGTKMEVDYVRIYKRK